MVSQQQLEKLSDIILGGVAITDKDGRIIFANAAIEEILGLKHSEIIGRSYNDPLWKAMMGGNGSSRKRGSILAQILAAGEPINGIQLALERPDGVKVPLVANVAPLHDGGGSIMGMVVSFTDAMDRGFVEGELRKWKDIFQNTRIGMIIGTPESNRLDLINPAFAEMHGYTVEELTGRHIFDVFAPECRLEAMEHIQATHRKDHHSFESKHIRKDGTIFPVLVDAVAVRGEDGAALYRIVNIIDISERKQAEELNCALNGINAVINSTLDFDEIMQKVVVESARVLGAETAAIDLYEYGRWVTAYIYGFPQEVAGVVLTDEEAPHAALAARTRRPVVVNDTNSDRRVNRDVMERFGIRSVLVVPLMIKGEVTGTLFFNHHSAAVPFTEAQVDFAQKLGVSISLAIENARLYAIERNIADTLQEALLVMPEEVPGVDFGYLYRSATEAARVGGDFYDIFEIEHGRVGIVVGDVSGKGLEAATLTSLVKNTIKAYAYEEDSPALIMSKVNQVVKKASSPEIFVTMFLGILSIKSGSLTYCNAGHPEVILKRKTGDTSFLTSDSPVIGVFANLSWVDSTEMLKDGDTLVLYTDGVTEARCDGGFFGDARLFNLVNNLKTVTAKEMPKVIFNDIMQCTGGSLSDDVAILAARFKGGLDG